MAKVAGRADGKRVSALVREELRCADATADRAPQRGRRRARAAAATPCCARSRATSSATCSCAATSSRSTASRGRRGRRDRRARARRAHRAGPRDRARHDRRGHRRARPARVAGRDPRGRRLAPPLQAGRAEDRQPEALRRLDPQATRHVRHRPGRHRQDVPRRRAGRRRAEPPRGQPDHPHAPRGRGRRAPRLPARRPHGEDRPLPAPAVRRAARHARRREGRRRTSSAARSRSRRWRSCAAARSRSTSRSSRRRAGRRSATLRVGDLVVGSDGRPTPVLGVFPQGRRDGVPRAGPGRRVDAVLRRAPVDGPHAGATGAAASRAARCAPTR